MLNISDSEEKKLIVAYSMARNKKHVGLENVWRQWCIWWKEDFSVNGGTLRMYDHRFIKSKKKVRERMQSGETDIHDFKEYDDFLVDLCKWIEANYDETISRKDNITILKNRLLKYKAECGRNISILFKKSGLKEKGYRLQNQTSVKHPLLLGKYVIFYKDRYGIREFVTQGSYEQITKWINNEAEVKMKNE